jgi:hypothetical protein
MSTKSSTHFINQKKVQQSGWFYSKELYTNPEFSTAYKTLTVNMITALNKFQNTKINEEEIDAMLKLETDLSQVKILVI